jgi:hypothetical protein
MSALKVMFDTGREARAATAPTACRLRAKTNFLRRINRIAVVSPFAQKIPLVSSGKSAADFRTSRPDEEGRFAIVTSVGQEMRWTWCVAADDEFADERHIADGEVAWSRPPGAEAKSAKTYVVDDGGKNAGPQGERV